MFFTLRTERFFGEPKIALLVHCFLLICRCWITNGLQVLMICSLTILALSIPYCPIPPYVARGFSSATLRKMSIMTKWGASSHQQVLLLLHLANALRWTIICTLLWISLPWVWQTSWQQQPAAGQRAIPLPYKSSTKHKLASRSVAQSHHWKTRPHSYLEHKGMNYYRMYGRGLLSCTVSWQYVTVFWLARGGKTSHFFFYYYYNLEIILKGPNGIQNKSAKNW